MPNDLLPITVADMIAELERELALRIKVYPHFIANGKLKRERADRQCDVLRAAIERLRSGA